MDDELDVMTISHTTLMYMSAKTGTLRILSPMATPLSLIMNAVQSHFFYGRKKILFLFSSTIKTINLLLLSTCPEGQCLENIYNV